MHGEQKRIGGPKRARMAAFVMMFVLGAALSAGRCMPPPKGVPKKDAATPEKKATGPDAPSPDEKLDAKVLGRVKPLKGVTRVHLMDVSGSLDPKRVATLMAELVKIPAGEAVVLEVDTTGGKMLGAAMAALLNVGAKPFVITWIRGKATGMAALLPLTSAIVAMAPRARYGAMGAWQFTTISLNDKTREALQRLFDQTAQLNGRPTAWARAMVAVPGWQRRSGMKPAVMKPAANKPAKASAGKTGPPPGRLVTLTALQARQVGMSDAIASDVGGLLRLLGLDKAEVLRAGKAVTGFAKPKPKIKRRVIDKKKLVAGTQRIVVVDIKGMVELGMLSFVKRTIGRTKSTDLVIVDIDTLGGRVDAAIRIRDALLRAKGKTLAYVHPRAISAGALIALSCDLIIMAPGGSMGAATPINVSGGKVSPVGEKFVSYLRKEFKATAEAKGRRGDLAEAMVDMSVEVMNVPYELKESISGLKKGKLLTLTTNEATQLDMSDGTASSFDDLVAQLGLQGVPVVRPKENWAEKLSRFLINPALAGILMIVGMLGLFIEMRTPGFGVAGIMGILCLAVVLFGHKIAGLGGWEPILLFGLGVVLLGVEIFITPGFGVLGGLGIIAVLAALVWAIIGAGGIPLTISWDQGYVTTALARVFGAIIVGVVFMALLAWLLPKAGGPFAKLVLSAVSAGDASAGAHDLPEGMESRQDLVGCTGVTDSALRPTGKARIDGKRLEVESRGGFVERGAQVEVVQVVGRRIVVKEVSK